MRVLMSVALGVPALVLGFEPDPIVGEWSTSQIGCRDTRMVFTLEGEYYTVVANFGRWNSEQTGAYLRRGDLIVITDGDVERRLYVVAEERDRLVVLGEGADEPMEWVRCPTF